MCIVLRISVRVLRIVWNDVCPESIEYFISCYTQFHFILGTQCKRKREKQYLARNINIAIWEMMYDVFRGGGGKVLKYYNPWDLHANLHLWFRDACIHIHINGAFDVVFTILTYCTGDPCSIPRFRTHALCVCRIARWPVHFTDPKSWAFTSCGQQRYKGAAAVS